MRSTNASKTTALLSVLAATLIAGTAMAIDPYAYWDFDEDIGTTALDRSGNDFNGSIMGAVHSAGVICFGLGLDCTDDWLSVPTDDFPTTLNTGSISMWIRLNADRTEDAALAAKSTDTLERDFCWLSVDTLGRLSYATKYQGTAEAGGYRTTPGTVPDNVWTHIVITADGVNTIKMYVNAVEESLTVINGDNGTNETFFEKGTTWAIGKLHKSTGDEGFFCGELDEVRFYETPLTQSEIDSLFNLKNPDPYAHYSFDDGTAVDETGNCFDGSVLGCQEGEGVLAGGLQFDCLDDWVSIPIDRFPAMPNIGSIAMWVKLRGDRSEHVALVAKSTDTLERDFCWLSVDTLGRLSYATKYQGTAEAGGYRTAPGTVPDDMWTHIVITADGVNRIKMYVNAVEESLSVINDDNATYETFFEKGTTWAIGKLHKLGGDEHFFCGSMDEVWFYNHALNEDEIVELFRSGFALLLPAPEAQLPCDDECVIQPVQVQSSWELGGVTIPIAIPEGVAVCSLSTAGLVTEDWDYQIMQIWPDSGFIFMALFNTFGEAVPFGTQTVANIFLKVPPECQSDYCFHWDTTLMADPSRQLLYSDPSGTVEIHPGFDSQQGSVCLLGYVTGDCDASGAIDISDLWCMVSYMFLGGERPCVLAALDVNGNETLPNISDLVYLVQYLFMGGPEPLCPGEGSPAPKVVTLPDLALSTQYDGGVTTVGVVSTIDLLGLELELAGTEMASPLSLAADRIEMFHGERNGNLHVGLLDMEGVYAIEAGSRALLEIPGRWEIVSALACDRDLRSVQPAFGSKVEPATPGQFALTQNYPNPFNPTTEISFSLPQAGQATLEIYNVMGQRVATLVDEYLEAGQYSRVWDASDNASGIYFYRLSAEGRTDTKKMLLLK